MPFGRQPDGFSISFMDPHGSCLRPVIHSIGIPANGVKQKIR